MNLRHSKPSYSYSESAPTPKIAQIIVKQDPKLRFYAQLLTNFIERTNAKCKQYQERLKTSKSKRKVKCSDIFITKETKDPSKKSKSKSKYDKLPIKNLSNGKKAQRQVYSSLETESTKHQVQSIAEFPIQFIDMILSLCGQVDSQSETRTSIQNNNIVKILEYQCSIHPEYVALLEVLYAHNYYIEGFHPRQLAPYHQA